MMRVAQLESEEIEGLALRALLGLAAFGIALLGVLLAHGAVSTWVPAAELPVLVIGLIGAQLGRAALRARGRPKWMSQILTDLVALLVGLVAAAAAWVWGPKLRFAEDLVQLAFTAGALVAGMLVGSTVAVLVAAAAAVVFLAVLSGHYDRESYVLVLGAVEVAVVAAGWLRRSPTTVVLAAVALLLDATFALVGSEATEPLPLGHFLIPLVLALPLLVSARDRPLAGALALVGRVFVVVVAFLLVFNGSSGVADSPWPSAMPRSALLGVALIVTSVARWSLAPRAAGRALVVGGGILVGSLTGWVGSEAGTQGVATLTVMLLSALLVADGVRARRVGVLVEGLLMGGLMITLLVTSYRELYPRWPGTTSLTPPPPPGVEVWHGQHGTEAYLLPVPGASVATPAPAVLFLHGNTEEISWWVTSMQPYTQRGISVLLVEYRGYGRSPGFPSAAALVEDAREFEQRLLGDPRVDPTRLILQGKGLGSGVALTLAEERPPRALVRESPFTWTSEGPDGATTAFDFSIHWARDPFRNLSRIERLQRGHVPLFIRGSDGLVSFGTQQDPSVPDTWHLEPRRERYPYGYFVESWEQHLHNVLAWLEQVHVLAPLPPTEAPVAGSSPLPARSGHSAWNWWDDGRPTWGWP